MERFEKLRLTMRYRLQGAASVDPRFVVALDAFNHSEKLFEGKSRKDGVTPVFMHPLEIAGYLMTIQASLRHPAESMAAAMLHDAAEDEGVAIELIVERYGGLVGRAVDRLSKEVGGRKKSGGLGAYFAEMADCPIATVVKGADRVNNQSSMVSVFLPSKQLEYIRESEQYILPMLKKARREFPDQEAAYENLKLVLQTQNALIRAIHAGSLEGECS